MIARYTYEEIVSYTNIPRLWDPAYQITPNTPQLCRSLVRAIYISMHSPVINPCLVLSLILHYRPTYTLSACMIDVPGFYCIHGYFLYIGWSLLIFMYIHKTVAPTTL